jgi:hypothetical protein
MNIRALYLAVIQFVFVSTWTLYVVFLPELLLRAGIEKAWLPRILLTDQLLMVVFDFSFGVAAARGMQQYGRIAPVVLGVSLASCLAFLLLPQADGSAPLLLGLTVVWVISSSALRAPLYALLSRHAASSERASIAGMMTLGMAAAGMLAPWLGMQLKGLDPALPFIVSSLALAALVLPLAAAERAAGIKADGSEAPPPANPVPAGSFFILLLAGALAFQIFFNLAAAPGYVRHFGSGALVWLMPLFWIGVAAGSLIAGPLGRRTSPFAAFAGGCILSAIAALFFQFGDAAPLAPVGQTLGGIGWGIALCSAFSIADGYSTGNGGARMVGALFSMLALAAVTRIGLNLAGLADTALVMPALLWLIAGATLLVAMTRKRPLGNRQVG